MPIKRQKIIKISKRLGWDWLTGEGELHLSAFTFLCHSNSGNYVDVSYIFIQINSDGGPDLDTNGNMTPIACPVSNETVLKGAGRRRTGLRNSEHGLLTLCPLVKDEKSVSTH